MYTTFCVLSQIIDVKTVDSETIVLDPQWLGAQVIGRLLAYETILHTPPTGLLAIDNIQTVFPKVQPLDIVRLLIDFGLAVSCTAGSTPVGNDVITATRRPMPDADLAVPCLDRSDGSTDYWPSGDLAENDVSISDKVT
jgi:hypothetical protein